jgi:hypothetical protein
MSEKKPDKKKTATKAGRPKADVDADMVEKLAGIGCPNSEIAALVGCSVATLDRNFAEVMHKGRENVKTRLRKKQIELALAGNVTLLIWLGKQMLGQAEKVEARTEHSGQIGGTLDPGTQKAVSDWARTIQSKIKSQRRGGK